MRGAGKLLAAGLTLWLLAVACRQAATFGFLYPTTSLRFDAPLEQSQVDEVREYEAQPKGPHLTFWGERAVWAYTESGDSPASQITFDGEPELAWPTEYLYGRTPVCLEPESCAVSTGLAWALWGGENVVGMELIVEEDTYRVSGVFSEEAPMLLRPDSTGFLAAELQNVPAGQDAYRFASSYAREAGLGEPSEILWGPGFAAWAEALTWLPLALAAVPLAGYGFQKVRCLSSLWRSVLGFGLAFLLALALPGLLELPPAWLLPTKWSDFDFWSRLWETLQSRCVDFLSLAPQSRDVGAKLALIKYALSLLGACILSGVLYRSSPKARGQHL